MLTSIFAEECLILTTGGGRLVEIPVSRNPNEMAGPLGGGVDARYVLPGQTLEYTVYFENVSKMVVS